MQTRAYKYTSHRPSTGPRITKVETWYRLGRTSRTQAKRCSEEKGTSGLKLNQGRAWKPLWTHVPIPQRHAVYQDSFHVDFSHLHTRHATWSAW